MEGNVIVLSHTRDTVNTAKFDQTDDLNIPRTQYIPNQLMKRWGKPSELEMIVTDEQMVIRPVRRG